jgi:phosphohistidine phosphatase SixA
VSETTVYLIRHAEAGERAAWTGHDPARPLSDAGRRQAAAIAQRLATTPLDELISSPFTRCVQTLEPLATAHGRSIRRRDELVEGAPSGYTEKIVLEAAAEGSAVVCVHGDGMSDLLDSLADRDVPLDGSLDDRAKGSTWVLRIVDGVIAGARYEPAPLV